MQSVDTQHLLLIRHAKTLPATGRQTDIQRELAPKGYRQGERMHAYLRSMGVPASATVLCSPSVRTRQTLQACLPPSHLQSVQFIDEIYAAYTGDLLNLLNNHLEQTPRWLIAIGHNPSLDSIVRWLSQGDPAALTGMATGCIASFSGTGQLLPENWRLTELFKPDKSALI